MSVQLFHSGAASKPGLYHTNFEPVRRGFLGRRLVVSLIIMLGVIFFDGRSASALNRASIGSVVIGSRAGSTVGLDSQVVLPTLGYCVSYSTDEQAMDFGHEVVDSLGIRPPYGGAFSSAFVFVPQSNWDAGETLPTRTVCNTITLERDKAYTIRAWVTSGSLETRGTWAISGSSAPTAATYTYAPVAVTTTTTTTTAVATTNSGESGSGSTNSQCPSSLPIRAEVNGKTTCVSLQQQCSANPSWSDPTRNLSCLSPEGGITTSTGFGIPKTCNASISTRKLHRVTLSFVATNSLGGAMARFEVERVGRWFVLGVARPPQKSPIKVVTTTQVLNDRGTYRVRITRRGEALCEGLLVVRRTMRLRGVARPV